ncbi:uncharacterized protein [Antedon mediterranea]|uniref:uncharacterized protein n=1 Tax=Antedon mediterranea TaxID=105859 RepID=UPI003AF7EBD4
MDTSSCLNALRRFFTKRGPAKQPRSDCGTNFVGACNILGESIQKEGQDKIKRYRLTRECEWVFNPPHASHMGGSWERMIGVARKIIDGMFRDLGETKLTHEVLVTLMEEVSGIINARPLVEVSTDPESPQIISTNTLLTQKSQPFAAPPGAFF